MAKRPDPAPAPREPILARALPDPAELRAWVATGPSPRTTVYLLLQAGVPEARQNALRLDQAATEVEQRLTARGVEGREAAAMVARLRAVDTDLARLPGSPSALAVLLDAEAIRAVALPGPPPAERPLVFVAASFALRPLLAAQARAGRYRALAFSVNRIALFEGGPQGLTPLERPGVPKSLTDALGEETTAKELQVRPTRRGADAPGFFSHGSAREERTVDWTRFHEVVGRALARALPEDGLPLVLATTEEHLAALRAVDKVPGLLDEIARGNADRLSPAELHERVWPIVDRARTRRAAESLRRWEQARNRGKGVDDLEGVAAAVLGGRVRRLWVDVERRRRGRLDPQLVGLAEGQADDDVFDALVERVVALGGEVIPLETTRVPWEAGVAAELY